MSWCWSHQTEHGEAAAAEVNKAAKKAQEAPGNAGRCVAWFYVYTYILKAIESESVKVKQAWYLRCLSNYCDVM